jgi:hypothetical protein
MRFARRLLTATTLLLALGLCTVPDAVLAQAGTCCVMPDNTSGTADHPPSCPNGYSGHLQIVDGLPLGTTVQIPAILGSPGGFTGLVQVPGGTLGGMQETWQSSIVFQRSGTGGLLGYNRVVNMPVSAGQTHSAPRVPFSPLQSFDTALWGLQGQLPPGDPDFDLLRITAGGSFGMPSPGHTTFTTEAGGWAVDSFFDITYRIDFVGSVGSPFQGMSGSTTRTHRFEMCHVEPTPVRAGTWGALKQLYR